LLGDPQEAAALSAVYGVDRADDGCFIGSGEDQHRAPGGGRGRASVIKAVLALWHAEIPASLLVSCRTRLFRGRTTGWRIATEHLAWPETTQPRRASVSGFGYGGTVAHIVLEQAAAESLPPRSDEFPRQRLFALSAASEEACTVERDLMGWLSMRTVRSLSTRSDIASQLGIPPSSTARLLVASGEADLIEKLRAIARTNQWTTR